jgi:hypothetical protein
MATCLETGYAGFSSTYLAGAVTDDDDDDDDVVCYIPLCLCYRPALGSTQPPIQWVPGVISPRVKRPRHEADHSPPSEAEV